MTTGRVDPMTRRIEAWLGQGVDDAPPPGLLELSLERARGTRQRAAAHALVGGAPWIGPAVPGRRPAALILVAALALALIAALAFLVGRSPVRPNPLPAIVPTVAPTATPTPSPTIRPTTSPETTPRGTVVDTPTGFAGAGFAITYPPGWSRLTGVSIGGSVKFTNGRAAGTFGYEYIFSVSRASDGGPISVQLGQQAGSVLVAGNDLEALAASVEANVTGAASTRTSVVIGGEPGYRYSTPELSIVGPLASIAITYRDGTAWVFTEHLFLDAPPSGDFGTFLASFSFQ